jgi:penicillin-binding protein 1C
MSEEIKYIVLVKNHLKTSIMFLSVLFFICLFFLLNLIFPLQINIKYSQIVVADNGSVIHAFLSGDEKWRMKTELQEIIPQLKQAIIEKEDKYFYFHPGVNPAALCRAAFNNILKRRKTSGASTITMQVARLLEPKERTHLNKIGEIFRAFQLEFYYNKEEILQMYLNLVPFGGNIEGVKSASLLYFDRLPGQLSLAQIVTLAIIPNRPTSLKLGKNNIFIVKERNRWLDIFRKEKVFPDEAIESAFREPLEAKRQQAPKLAPHFSYKVKNRYPQEEIIKTALKKPVFQKVEQITYNYVQRLKRHQINNAAVIVLNNQTRCIEVYLGSPDFKDKENAGQVDGISAIRSPGSTLKPLIYAAAFDAGLITPKTIITDVPTDFGGYAPENFDRKFNGKVSVEKALAYSLNIPAVKILEEITLPAFIQKLKKAGFHQIGKDENNLGLSLALGGCGVTLEELTTLFASFANRGKLNKYKYIQQEVIRDTIQLVSPSAAYMITEILTQITRPDLPNHFESSYHVPRIAWKTGTSYGRRDAWSIGYNKKYTIGVWVGNFSGKGIHELTGADIATPLLFELFNSLDYNSQNNWFSLPKELTFRYVCAESGNIPEDHCQSIVMDYFIPKISSAEKCQHMKNIWTSPDESFSFCTHCLPDNGYKKKLYPNHAPELIDFYKSQNISYAVIPEHNPSCTRVFMNQAPKIISPASGKEYVLDKEEPAQMMLKCNTDNEVKRVYWYINNKFYKSAGASEKVFFTPTQGQIKISCSDDKGRNSNASIIVYYQ